MPRRYPLLGTEDPMEVKQQRAFTMQAEQDIWDIGTSANQRRVLDLRISKFRRGMESGKYPFEQDHSGTLTVPRLAWLTEIQNLDYTLLIPDLIEGLTDNHEMFYTIADLALCDIIRHGPLEKIVDALPTLTIAVRDVLEMNNLTIARRVVSFLKRLCSIQPAIGPDLAFYMRDLLVRLNYYMEIHRNNRDQIVYQEKLSTDLYDQIDELVQLFLRIAGSEFDVAARNIKKAIPTYQVTP